MIANFFSTSPMGSHWRLLYGLLKGMLHGTLHSWLHPADDCLCQSLTWIQVLPKLARNKNPLAFALVLLETHCFA
jgi:hypothetical protein